MTTDRTTEALRHEVRWIDAGRDEPPSNGYWSCTCGSGFAPDGVDEYAKHLSASVTARGPEALRPDFIARKFGDLEERLDSLWEKHGSEELQGIYFALLEARSNRVGYEALALAAATPESGAAGEPMTEAGRALLEWAETTYPGQDPLRMWREHILAIEAEAAGEPK